MNKPAAIHAGRFCIAPDHPALPGHFPGDPLAPGVVLLNHAFALILRESEQIASLDVVKFITPVRPDQNVDVWYDPLPPDGLSFLCLLGDQVVLRGNARLMPSQDKP